MLVNHHPCLSPAIIRYLETEHADARQVILGGSHAQGTANTESDIDLLIIKDSVPFVLRQVKEVEGQVLDLAIHDFKSLSFFLQMERRNGSRGLAEDIVNSICLMEECAASTGLKSAASAAISAGAGPFDIETLKIHMLGQLSDLRVAASDDVRFTIGITLVSKLMLFVARLEAGWISVGKYLARDLNQAKPSFITRVRAATEQLVNDQDARPLEELVHEAVLAHTGNLDRCWQKRYSLPNVSTDSLGTP